MADDYTLSLSQIAQQLNAEKIDIAESTVRKYARLYKEFLPSRKLEGERWEKYPPVTVDIIRRIFTLSESGKSRHEIKIMLKADGFSMTLEADTSDHDDTVTEPTQPYNDTPPPTSSSLQRQHTELVTHYSRAVMQEAAASLKLYHRLMEEKNYQIQELEARVKSLKTEKQAVQAKYQAELLKVLDEVVQWQNRKPSVEKQRTHKRILEPQ